jgi:hypothetical protein
VWYDIEMKRVLSSLLVTTMLVSSMPAWADATAAAVSPISKGQTAPYTGVLLSPQALAQIVAQQDTVAAAMQLAVQHQSNIDAAQSQFQIAQQATTCTADKSDLQAQVDDDKKQINTLTVQLKHNTGGLGAPTWIGVGVVGGVALSVLTAFAISKVTK